VIRLKLSQTLKDTHAPQTAAAGFILDVTVLLELVRLNVIAGGQAAAGTVGILIRDDITPETSELM
jgi:hypothetical protein